MPRVVKLVLGQLVLLVVVLVVAILAAEWIARRRFPDLRYSAERQARPEDLFVQFDARYGWANRPGADVRFTRRDFDTRVVINSAGFRGPVLVARHEAGSRPADRATEAASSAGAARGAAESTEAGMAAPVASIAILGDSYVFGHGVEEEETFAARLRARWPGAQVGNFGVIGYSTDQELLLLRDVVLPLAPDLVILCLYENDILDNGQAVAWGLYPKPRFLRAADGTLALEREQLDPGLPFGLRLRRELRQRFVLYDVVAFRLAALRARSGSPAGAGPAPGMAQRAGSAGDGSAAEILTRTLLDEAVRLAAEADVPFLLVVLPGLDDLGFLEGAPPAGTGARLDLEPILARYQEAHPDSALGFVYDSHWNPRGHRLVADAIATLVEAQGWVPAGNAQRRVGSAGSATPEGAIDAAPTHKEAP